MWPHPDNRARLAIVLATIVVATLGALVWRLDTRRPPTTGRRHFGSASGQ